MKRRLLMRGAPVGRMLKKTGVHRLVVRNAYDFLANYGGFFLGLEEQCHESVSAFREMFL
jgi:hypothetical protein